MTPDDATAVQDPRAAEARRLREEEGLSLAQIRALIPVGNDRLNAWLKGTTPPEWTKRPQAKDDQREAARELRKKGLTYDEIVDELGCSKSSVSLWTRDVSMENVPRPGWSPRARRLREEATERRRQKKIDDRWGRREAASAEFGSFSRRELLIAGVIAYWCEGSKWKDWNPSPPQVAFINSDPALIRLFLRFVEAAPVQHGGHGYRLNLHESADEEVVKDFWMRELGLKSSDFSKTTWKRHNPKTVRKNVGDEYHGCLTVVVRKSRDLYLYMDGLIGAVLGDMAPRPHRGLWSMCGSEVDVQL